MTKFARAAMVLASAAALQTSRPGEMTQAKVWVQGTPLPVCLVTRDGEEAPMAVRSARQEWEYETVRIAGQEGTTVLNRHGAAGWEAVAVVSTAADGTTLLLKRPALRR